MSRYRLWGAIFLVPALVALLSTLGCGGGNNKGGGTGGGTTGGGAQSSKGEGTRSSGPTKGDKTTALEATETATLKGKVTYDGTPPPRRDFTSLIEKMENPKDRSHCFKGEHSDETWVVGDDKGVKSVIVWLRAPAGKYFKIPEDMQMPKEAQVDQPFCAFTPHVQAITTTVWDPKAKKQTSTGLVFKIKNSAPINHNTDWKGRVGLNGGASQIIPAGKDLTIELFPCKDTDVGGEDLINLRCDIHKWMTGKIAVFDHPFHAVTDEHGNYEIKNAPAGVPLSVVYWHESSEKPLRNAPAEEITLKKGENTKDFTIK